MESLERDKVDELLDLTRENNRILRKMHRSMVWSQIFSFIYWLFILGALGWSYYYFQPYIQKYIGTYERLMNTLNSVEQQGKTLPDNFKGILEKVR